jgi:hypothetical protein
MTPELLPLEPRDTPATGVVYRWNLDAGRPAEEVAWLQSVIAYGVNTVAGQFTNPAVPVVYLEISEEPPQPGAIGDAWQSARYFGHMRFDFRELFSGRHDVTAVIAHEAGHALTGCYWHNPEPADLMYRHARPAWMPWDGTFTRNDVLAFLVMGFTEDE